jgi:quinohemoprotein amine dehydrogenase
MLFAGALLSRGAAAQPAQVPAAPPAVAVSNGIPVESELVRQKCGTCHKVDAEKRMSRISYRRASPENWELTIKRMIGLNKLQLEPADARAILKYLSDHQGLAPDEVRPVRFEAERRTEDFTYEGDRTTAQVCSACHSLGRVLSERRTKEEWNLLLTMHRGYYPLVDSQPLANGMGFRRSRPADTTPSPDGRLPDNRQPMEKIVDHLSQAFPLVTPAWAAWSASMQPAQVAGTWLVSGYEIGVGRVFGRVTVTADTAAPDSFDTQTSLALASSGKTMTRAGKAVIYTGYAWRGRESGEGDAGAWRQVMMLESGGRQMTGRWFTGAYDETGVDVTMVKAGADPIVAGTSAISLKAGATSTVTIFGANFPSTLESRAVDLGPGIRVTKVSAVSADRVDVEATVAQDAKPGPRDVSVNGFTKPGAFVVYTKIDGIKVLPRAGLARVGGAVFPKQFQQFEAVAYADGPDGKPDTADDLMLGPVDSKWSVEEYTATFDDDDARFAGSIDAKGLFTPAVDGPDPERSGERNNVGDLWVVAEYTPPAAEAKALKARAYLLVSVPIYMRWYGVGSGQ